MRGRIVSASIIKGPSLTMSTHRLLTEMATFNYFSFLPGKLDPALQALTKVYKNNTDRLTEAYFQTPLPGVHTSARTYPINSAAH